MDSLISRQAAIEAIKKLLYEPDSVQYIWSSDALSAVKHAPSVPAVPLDKLCEWLVGNRLEIPCKCCEHYLGDDKCSAINDMAKPCPNTKSDWRRALTEWMEGPDEAD